MIYLDTNVIISMHVVDSTSAAAVVWASQQTAQTAISTWNIAEFVGNISLRVRKGEIPARGARRVVDAFDSKFSPSLVVLGVNDAAHLRVAHWLRDSSCSMQRGDALHVAIALEGEAAAIATFDQRFARNIEKLRIPRLKVIALPTSGTPHKTQQKLADYNVTEKDIANAAKWARKRKRAEKESASRLTVRR